MIYEPEAFTPDEAAILSRYFTNVDRPVFALINLPEVVKAALFGRYSRTLKSLRRLFLDEFINRREIVEMLLARGYTTADERQLGLRAWEQDSTTVFRLYAEHLDEVEVEDLLGGHAEKFFERIFVEYGDDSVAQLGGVHLACESVSNLLTKVLEWGRLMGYLEQSTRYLDFSKRGSDGRYRYYSDDQLAAASPSFQEAMDRIFDEYAAMLPSMIAHFEGLFPRQEGTTETAHRGAIRAKAYDSLRGLLPAATLSNLGIYGDGQAYEALLIRMNASPLQEVRDYAKMMLEELRQVIPDFMKRVDREDRGSAWSAYIETTHNDLRGISAGLLEGIPWEEDAEVVLERFEPDAVNILVAECLFEVVKMPLNEIVAAVGVLDDEEKISILKAYAGERTNRRHKPGRSFEAISYTFVILSNYGAFRDLQRHRMLTIRWQSLTACHGFEVPASVKDAGLELRYRAVMAISAAQYEALTMSNPDQASYAVCFAYRIRYSMQFNLREAFHMLELRTGEQAHPDYRRVCFEMFRLIRDQAGHGVLTDLMTFIGNPAEGGLERLRAESQAAARRSATTAEQSTA